LIDINFDLKKIRYEQLGLDTRELKEALSKEINLQKKSLKQQ
jgi:hypothetical protein